MNSVVKTVSDANTPDIARAKPAKLNWEDPFLLEQSLTEDERMIRDSAATYCQSRLLPRVIEANRNEVFDKDIMSEMGELGLLGSTIPEEFGGAGTNYVSYGLVAREVERIDSGYRSAMSVQSSLVCLLYTSPSPRDRQKSRMPSSA